MKITAIDSCVLAVPTSKQMALEFPHHKLVVAQIRTDEGLEGLGYSRLRDPEHPQSAINRRVQITNIGPTAAAQ